MGRAREAVLLPRVDDQLGRHPKCLQRAVQLESLRQRHPHVGFTVRDERGRFGELNVADW